MMMKNIILSLFLIIPFLSLNAQEQSAAEEEESPREQTGGIFPSEAQGSDTNKIEADRDPLNVFGKIEAPVFTKELHIAAQSQNEIRPNYYILEGYVDLVHEGARLQADHAEYDANTKDLIATGNVVLDQESQHLTGTRLEMNLETKKGTMYNARGFVPPQIFFWGTKLEKIGEDEYKLYDGVFTECNQVVPHWRLKTSTAKMTLNETIRFNNFLVKAKSIPIFYSPFMMWPIKRERSTGFLFPSFGPNNNKGFWVGGSFFWAMTKYMDSTYWLDHYAERGFGGGSEFRYAASKESDGMVKGYYMNDRVLGSQYAIEGNMRQELPWDLQLKATVDYFSSLDYIKDYSGSVQRGLSQTNIAQGFLTRNWSYYSLNFLTEYSERLSSSANRSSFFHLPELDFQARPQKLGPTPFFISGFGSFSELGRGTETATTSDRDLFERIDLFPTISFPINYLAWMSITPTYGYRLTHYTASRDRQQIIDVPVTRRYSEFVLDFRGPNFAKIFDTPDNGYSKKWKHAIEPQIKFDYRQDIPELREIFTVDSDIDQIAGARTVTYSLTNLLYAKRPVKPIKEYKSDEYQYYKPVDPESLVESAWEFISWRISQSYLFNSDSFDTVLNPDLKPFSPISSVIRVNPALNYSIQQTTSYDVNLSRISAVQVGATLKNAEKWYANLNYGYRFFGEGRASGNSIQSNGAIGFWKNKLVLESRVEADLSEKVLLGQGWGITWNDDCFSVGVQYRYYSDRVRARGQKESQFTFSISLPNIGSLVDYQGGAAPKRF